jgi:dephospho-CoA kinase
MHKGMKEIILAYTPENVQLERLMARDNIARVDAMAKIRSQMPVEEKKKHATIIIDNSLSIKETYEQAIRVFNQLRNKLAMVD